MLRKTLLILISIAFLAMEVFGQQPTPEEDNPELFGKPEEKVLIDFAKLPEHLAVFRWGIELSGYSDNPLSRKASSLKIVDVDLTKLKNKKIKDKYDAQVEKTEFNKALGARVYFEYSHGNDWAKISPWLPISTYDAKEGEGILRNVGPIKSISMWVCGRNYKNAIEVRLVDNDGKFKCINFGILNFPGWQKLVWENPNYIKELRKRDLIKDHLYPRYYPYLKFDSVVIYKSHQESGGEFVTYVKDIRIEYEQSVKDYESTIKDEDEWGIQEERANRAKRRLDMINQLNYMGSDKQKQYESDQDAKSKAAGGTDTGNE